MKTAVIVLNYNGKNDTLECLASLKKAQAESFFSIIIVDNGSHDGSLLTFQKLYPDEIYIDNQKNLGYAGGNNEGIKYALNHDFEFICLLNNDTIVDPLFLKELLSFHLLHPQTILGTMALRYYDRTLLDHLGGKWNPQKALFDLIGYKKDLSFANQQNLPSLDYVCGCCLFASRKLYETIGLFDPRYFLFWEESDLCQRAQKQGYRNMTCTRSILWHKVSASFTGGKPHTSYYFWRNRLLWIEKNLCLKEKINLYLKVLSWEILKVARHYFLKKGQVLFLSFIRSAKTKEKKNNLLLHQACFQGIKDYFLRRFYEGPSFLMKRDH